MSIVYKIEDILNVEFSEPTIILHCCNDVPVMGSGIAGAIAKKWPHITIEYEEWNKDGYEATPYVEYISHPRLRLGEIQVVNTDPVLNSDLLVCNMIGQRDCGPDVNGNPPVRYEAFEEGFGKLVRQLKGKNAQFKGFNLATVKLGAGLAGGNWDKVAEMLNRYFVANGVSTTVYDLPPRKNPIQVVNNKFFGV